MKWMVLVTFIAVNVVQLPSPLVRTKDGLVRGRVVGAGRFHLFLGIPYGTVDKRNRFQAPLPPPKWEGILDAINENTWCTQRVGKSSITVGQPDCLKLNINAPANAKPGDRLPVMVFIHGGCFFEGMGTPFVYGGDFFTEHGVIYVGINYRLSVEGFLCLGIKEAPGNAGLKDQVAALRWIKENIREFGGDPDNVTLFGESAGAVSISFLLLSMSARGLFSKVILQSGSALSPWGLQHDPIKTASNIAREFGQNSTDPEEIYETLSKRSPDELINAIKYSERKNWITAETLFVPCIEETLPGVEPIITEFPTTLIKTGNYTKVPMIIGFNDNEGIFFVGKDYGTSLKKVDTAETLQPDLVFPSAEAKNSTVERIEKHYFSSGKDELIMDMVDLYSDVHFKYPSVLVSELYSKTSDQPVFYYLFKYSGLINVGKTLVYFIGAEGASHADELLYMFRPHALPMVAAQTFEGLMMERLTTLWTNFAKYSNPTPRTSRLLPIKWRPSRESIPRALVIDYEFSTAPMWHEQTMRLWNDIYSQFRRKEYGFQQYRRNSTKNCCGRRHS
uniref:Carboxylic ester hydrolase n=1 Tax=Ostrinia furnacalis TaxID=93504 RepID=A0A0F7QJY8_OSTFU|nr:carboxylesterase [Ostrinia furnacalis]